MHNQTSFLYYILHVKLLLFRIPAKWRVVGVCPLIFFSDTPFLRRALVFDRGGHFVYRSHHKLVCQAIVQLVRHVSSSTVVDTWRIHIGRQMSFLKVKCCYFGWFFSYSCCCFVVVAVLCIWNFCFCFVFILYFISSRFLFWQIFHVYWDSNILKWNCC